jgi:hypothetical protein
MSSRPAEDKFGRWFHAYRVQLEQCGSIGEFVKKFDLFSHPTYDQIREPGLGYYEAKFEHFHDIAQPRCGKKAEHYVGPPRSDKDTHAVSENDKQ